MKQLNLVVTPEFDKNLRTFMKRKGIASKSAAIRCAMRDAVAKSPGGETDFRSWIGIGLKEPLNPRPRYQSEDELWS